MAQWRSEGWVQVAETAQPYEAELIALKLREAGMDARVVDQTFRQEPLPSVRSFAVVRVLVPEDKEEQAREALAQPADLPEDAEWASKDEEK
jgi:Putative prokaryotic signal transducing protein